MPCAVTLTARDIVAQCMAAHCPADETMKRLRRRLSAMVGFLHIFGLDEGTLNRARTVGQWACTTAIADLPEEQAKLFLPLAAISPTVEAFDGNFCDLAAIFSRVFNATARFDGDDEEGVSV